MPSSMNLGTAEYLDVNSEVERHCHLRQAGAGLKQLGMSASFASPK